MGYVIHAFYTCYIINIYKSQCNHLNNIKSMSVFLVCVNALSQEDSLLFGWVQSCFLLLEVHSGPGIHLADKDGAP